MQGVWCAMLDTNVILSKVKDFYINDIPSNYVTYSITPTINTDNKEVISLANSISSLYKPPRERVGNFNIKSKNLFTFQHNKKCFWDIVLSKKKTEFFFTVHEDDTDLLINKAKTVWSGCNIKQDVINTKELECSSCCEMVLKTFNFKSLSTDMSNQYPLTNMVSITKSLMDDEYIRVNIVIEPTSRLNWISQAKEENKRYDSGEVLNNDIGLKDKAFKMFTKGMNDVADLYIQLKMIPIEAMFGLFLNTDIDAAPQNKEDKRKTKVNRYENLDDDSMVDFTSKRSSSNYKSAANVYKSRISIISYSKNQDRANIGMIATANAYKDLTQDNELIIKPIDDSIKKEYIRSIVQNTTKSSKMCVLCDKELSKIIQLPQKTLQQEYKMSVIDTRESDIPKELQGGNVRICEVDESSKNKKTVVTFPTDTNLLARKTVILGGENSGKTTQLMRFSTDFYRAKVSNFVIDHQENGKLTDQVSKPIPKDDHVIYDVYNEMPPLAFTEISKRITEDMDNMTRLDYANMIAKQVELFVNSITDDNTGNLTANMKRFLHSACMVTFIRPKATINDAFEVLRNYQKRNEALRYARYSELFDVDDDILFDLEELHKRSDKASDKGKIIGTREDLIVGITNRINILKQNPRIKAMLKKEYDENDDLDKYIQSGKSIFVKIPQNKFPDDDTRDMLAVFYFSRLWLTVQIREENKDSKLCHVVLDEIKALPTLASFMEKHLTEFRRHRLALTITAHGLAQFGKLLKQLKDSGANFIILPPTEKNNIELLKEEILPFTVEEALELKPFYGLCVINYGNRYAKFIGKMFKD